MNTNEDDEALEPIKDIIDLERDLAASRARIAALEAERDATEKRMDEILRELFNIRDEWDKAHEALASAVSCFTLWTLKEQSPESSGWYYVRNLDWSLSSRYYDNSCGGSWWNSTNPDGWTPNDSFLEWLFVPEVHEKKEVQS